MPAASAYDAVAEGIGTGNWQDFNPFIATAAVRALIQSECRKAAETALNLARVSDEEKAMILYVLFPPLHEHVTPPVKFGG
jgi:hypothetical protein